MKPLLTLVLLLCAFISKGQPVDPGFGGGSTTLTVSAGNTVYANQSRAYGELTSAGTIYYFDFENHVGANFDHTKPFLLVQTEYNGTGDNMGFIWPYSINHTGSGEGKFFMNYSVGLATGHYQVIQVDEYNSAQIDGTLTVDAYDPADGHGGILCVLVDGTVTFGINGKIDVSGKGLDGANGGSGGTAAVLNGTAGASVGLGNYNTAGNDAGPSTRTYFSIRTRGEALTNLDLACGTDADIQGLNGGLGAGQLLGGKGTNGSAAVNNADDTQTGYSTTTGEGGRLTVGSGGNGGNGGWRGASAGGFGGSGASNGFYDGTTTNTSQKAGPGTAGTGPTANTGYSDADAGDGGKGGRGGGAVFFRARHYVTHIGKKHFVSNGGDGAAGEDGHGEGGNGGDGGKGADGYCSNDGSNSQLHPAGGNGGYGIGGNGADAGNGGQGGEGGCVWLWYDASSSQIPTAAHCQFISGDPGFGGSGTDPGISGTQFLASEVGGESCDCEGIPTPTEHTEGNDCACFENFDKLKNMSADGTTAGGFKKWSDANGNYCYYDTNTDQLICYEEEDVTPSIKVKRTTKCGAFDCGAWVGNLFDDMHTNGPTMTIAGGEATWTHSGSNTVGYNFKTGVLSGPANQECTKDCDPDEEEENETIRGPRKGTDGAPGPLKNTSRDSKINPLEGVSPPTSLKERLVEQGVEVFPNPAHDVLIVKTPHMIEGEYSVINAVGQVFKTGSFNSTTFEIDLTKFDIGWYFVQLSHNGQTLSVPFEKQ